MLSYIQYHRERERETATKFGIFSSKEKFELKLIKSCPLTYSLNNSTFCLHLSSEKRQVHYKLLGSYEKTPSHSNLKPWSLSWHISCLSLKINLHFTLCDLLTVFNKQNNESASSSTSTVKHESHFYPKWAGKNYKIQV